jgi:FkbM family methyltransferase
MLEKELKKIKNLKSFSFKSTKYKNLKKIIIKKISKQFRKKEEKIFLNKGFSINHPLISFGNISSLNLLEIDELLIFIYYFKNHKKYQEFIDIGSNIGLHSIIMSKLGLKVHSFEPDPWHFKILKKNIKKNKTRNIKIHQYAISNKKKLGLFTRVLGNTTGSHITGSKKNVYNDIKQFIVKIIPAKNIIKKNSLIKIDAEGEEGKIINSLDKKSLINNDFICEVGNKKNALLIYKKLKKTRVNCYSQKINFKKVSKISDIPVSYKEGSLFISLNNKWEL